MTEHRIWKKINGGLIFCVIFVLLVIGILIFGGKTRGMRPFNGKSLIDYSQGWKDSDGQEKDLSELDLEETADGSVDLVNTIPVDMDESTDLNFRSKAVDFSVYIDGSEVYSYFPDLSDIAGRSYGSTFHHIYIDKENAGSTITIHAVPIYHDNSSFFNMMKLGNSGDYYQWFMRSHFASFIICLNIIGIGFLLVIMSLLIWREEKLRINTMSLGFLALMLGTWSCLQTLVPQMLMGNMEICQGINYLLLTLVPYAGICFINTLLEKPQKKYTDVVLAVTLIDLLVNMILNYAHVRDYHEMLPAIHISFVITVTVMIIAIIQDLRGRTKAKKRDNVLVFSFGIFVACAMIDMVRCSMSDNGIDDNGFFVRIGLSLFILIMFCRSMMSLLNYMKIAAKAETIKKIAYTDALTGIPNRASFVMKETELKRAIDDGTLDQLLVCQMDINNLKMANDNFGHAVGDELIMRASNTISTGFRSIGDCYRVGGDEFTIFVTKEPNEENFDKAISYLTKIEKEYNSREDVQFHMQIAYGISMITPECAKTIEEAEREADDDMYRRKRQMKAEVI